MGSSAVHPFRPPKSPSSSLHHTHVISPNSPTHNKRKTKTNTKSKSTPENALSPTSVVDPRGLFREQRRTRKTSSQSSSSRRSLTPAPPSSNKPVKPDANEADRSLVQSGNQCIKDGNSVGAVFCFSLLVDERKRLYGPTHQYVSNAMNDLGMVHLQFGDYKRAEKEFAQAAAMLIRSKKAHPMNVVKCLVNLGQSRLMQEKLDGARSVFRDAVKIVRTKLGYDDVHVAEVQSQVGCLLFEAGDFATALHAFADALAVHRANNANPVAVAETLCNIGSIHLEQKSFDPATDCFLEALKMQREALGDFHPDVIVTLDNLAFVHTKKRDYDKALKFYNETLQAQVALYGEFTQECSETKRKEQLVYNKYIASRRIRERTQTA